MAVTGVHDFTPENAFRTDLLNAVESHDFHWSAFTLADQDIKRTVTLRCGRTEGEDADYAAMNEVRTDVVAALDEHGYTLTLLQLGDKEDDRTLTVKAVRVLGAGIQQRLPS